MPSVDPSEIKHYDLQGYSRDEHVRRAGCCFELRDFELHSLSDIKTGINKALKKGKLDTEKLENDFTYLDHLEAKLRTISMTEEREGMVNLPLKRDLESVVKLKAKVAELLNKLQGASDL